MAEEEDIISTLPDAILCHILSFLETNYADATSVLSKRWNHLWRSVHTLRFITQDDVPKDIREDDDIEDWVDSDVVPECLSLHLRTCNLFKLSGLQDELMLARCSDAENY
ncbi:F-box/FBD/LRR-repeat protein At2g04230 isoform X2 [Medicago truncatula]|uniref:F-box/FBD/LRR-repeat protein At2g04230 isoform X2 n=1 Tax=Medicago truncatula TaxID=3880 RepID=UPI000D2F2339|nr:F-box/FBD/LRR-repeat protein At2g04230 isoform X2 [Medicago truncatula]